METVNWRDLPAGRELDRVIAERLGYYVVKATMYSPKGTLLGGDYRIHSGAAPETPESIAQCWEFYGPRWSTNVDTALMLWGTDSHWSINPIAKNGRVYFEAYYPDADSDYGETCEEANTPAWAICRAWLSWMDTKEVKA